MLSGESRSGGVAEGDIAWMATPCHHRRNIMDNTAMMLCCDKAWGVALPCCSIFSEEPGYLPVDQKIGILFIRLPLPDG